MPLRNKDIPNYFLVRSVFYCCATNLLDKTKKCNNSELIYLFILDLQVVFCKNYGRLSFFIFTCIVS